MTHILNEKKEKYVSNSEYFMESPIPTKLTKLTKIPEDGACLYHCFSIYLSQKDNTYWKQIIYHLIKEKVDISFLINDSIFSYFEEGGEKNGIFTESFINDYIKEIDIATIYKKKTLEQKSRWIQNIIIEWVYKNKNSKCYFSTIGDFLEIELLIMSSIDLDEIKDFEEYYRTYQIYAGDPDFITEEDPKFVQLFPETFEKKKKELEKDSIKTRSQIKKSKTRKQKIHIPYRWGGTSDIYVFSYLFQITINVFELVRENKEGELQNCSIRFFKSSFLRKEDTFLPFHLHEISENIKNFYLENHLFLLYGGNQKFNKNHYSLFDWN